MAGRPALSCRVTIIGSDLTGMVAIGNTQFGIRSGGTADVIGGATDDGHGNPSPGAAPGNLVSGSTPTLAWSARPPSSPATWSASMRPEPHRSTRAGYRRQRGWRRQYHHRRPEPERPQRDHGRIPELAIGGVGDVQVLNNYFGTDITGTIGLDHIGQNVGDGWSAISISGAGPNIVIGCRGPATSSAMTGPIRIPTRSPSLFKASARGS